MTDKDRTRRLGQSHTITFYKGQQVEIRKMGDRRFRPYTIQRKISARTTKRKGQTVFAEYLNYEIRYTYKSELFDKKFGRY